MIRSTKTTLRFTNTNKVAVVHQIIDEYKRVMSEFIDILWNIDKCPALVPYEITNKIQTWLSARMKQCVAKQASGIVRGTKQKQKQRLFVINKLNNDGFYKKARKLQAIYDKNLNSKPKVHDIELELDSRFIKIETENINSFDGWIIITSIGNKLKLEIPFKRTKHYNKLNLIGKIKSGIRLSKSNITFMFDCKSIENQSNTTVGIDIGVNSLLSVDTGSTRFQSGKDIHGHDLNSINSALARKKVGSNSFKRTQSHRTNYINHQINLLNWDDIKILRIEKIRNLRKGKPTSRKLKHFTYNEIFDRLKLKSEEHNVYVQEISPTYTSQRCSCCGWTRKTNRNGLIFKCEKCSNEQNSDLNASTNIRLNLREIGNKERLLHKNRIGFYWNELSREPIVRDVLKAE